MKHLLLGAAAALALSATAFADTPQVSTARMADNIRILSADDFQGREPATPAEAKTVDYIIKQFQAAGLQPGGDPKPGGGRAWTQDVPLAKFQISGPVKFEVSAGGASQSWTQGQQVRS